jgi:signal transduction histidine kinase
VQAADAGEPEAVFPAAELNYRQYLPIARLNPTGPSPEFAAVAQADHEPPRQLDELEAERDDLRRALKLRDELVSMVAHELRTPLGVMALELDIRRQRLDRGDPGYSQPEQLRAMLAKDERQVRSMARLIEDLLDFSRIQQGQLSLRPRRTDLGELARSVVAGFAARHGDAPLDIHVEPGVVGDWDDGRIAQMLARLLDNALRQGPDRPVRVDVGRSAGAMARLAVTGQGLSIPPEALSLEPRERPPASGMGLGLYISRHVVQAHGGSISVHGEPGAGVCLAVLLPMTEASQT